MDIELFFSFVSNVTTTDDLVEAYTAARVPQLLPIELQVTKEVRKNNNAWEESPCRVPECIKAECVYRIEEVGMTDDVLTARLVPVRRPNGAALEFWLEEEEHEVPVDDAPDEDERSRARESARCRTESGLAETNQRDRLSPPPRRRWLADGRAWPQTAPPPGELRPTAPQQVAPPEFPESTCPDRRASAARVPQRCPEASAELHGPVSGIGASGTRLLGEIRCGFESKYNSQRMGGVPRRRFAAAGLLPLALA